MQAPFSTPVPGELDPQVRTWTRFRGPNGIGVGTAEGIRVPQSEKDYAWKASLPGTGHSSPVVWQDKIFVTSAEDAKGKRHLICLDARNGKKLWIRTYDFRPYRLHNYNTSASSTPTVDKHRVYAIWPENDAFLVVALAHDGREVWRRDLGPFPTQHGGAVSPILYNGSVFFAMEPENARGGLYALHCQTGKTVWKIEREGRAASYSVPFVHSRMSGWFEIVFVSQGHGITGVIPETGEIKWELKDAFPMRCVSSPIAVDNHVFASCGEGGGSRRAVMINTWYDKPMVVKAGIVYEIRRHAPYVPTPLEINNLIYLWGDNGILTCVHSRDGQERWQERVGGNYFGSPVFTDNRLWAMNTRGELVVVEMHFPRMDTGVTPGPERVQQIVRFDLGEPSHATPAIANRHIYLRTLSHLIALGPSKRA